MPSPVIFISAATVDLKTWRDHLHHAFSRAGFRVRTQDESLESATGDVKRLLTKTIAEADCVIHLAGEGYGGSAAEPFLDAPGFKCSWTQFEYYHAHQQGKDVIAFVCAPNLSAKNFVEKDDPLCTATEKKELQEKHRQRVAKGSFIGTPLEAQFTNPDGTQRRTANEAEATTEGKLLEHVAAAIGTLKTLEREDREKAQRELRAVASGLAGVNRKLIASLVLLVLLGLGVWWVKRDTGAAKANTEQIITAQQTTEKSTAALAAQVAQVHEALSFIRQQTDPANDPISKWSQDRLEKALAEQMKMKVEDLRSILAAGRTSLDALVAGQALLASGKNEDAGKKFDLVLHQEKAAADRMMQAYEGKAQIAFDLVHYTEALDYRQKAAALVDKATAPLAWADAQGEVTVVLFYLSRFDESEPIMREIVSIRKEMLSPTAPELAEALNNLAAVCEATNRMEEAERLSREAVRIYEVAPGELNPKVAITVGRLAALLYKTNRLSEAESLFRKALKVSETSRGPNHPEVALALNNLGLVLGATNRLSEAELLMHRALKIDEARYGADHPNVARDLGNLATLYHSLKRLGEAEPLLQRALKIDEASYGANHPNVAISLGNLAVLLKDTNRPSEAEPLIRRALKIHEISYGADHPDVATDLSNLAQLLTATNRMSEAEQLIRRALKISEASYGSDHPNLAVHLNNLAQLLQTTNRMSEAEVLMQRALKIDEASYGPNHPNVATDLNNLGSLFKVTNRLSEAEPLMQRALKIDENSYGADSLNVAIQLNNLAGLLHAAKRISEAEPLMRRAVSISLRFRSSTGHEDPNFKRAVTNYLSMLKDLNLSEAEQRAKLESLAGELGMERAEVVAQFAFILGPFDVMVTEVVPEGQGPALGVKVGDVIHRYNGDAITNVEQLVTLTGETKAEAIPLEIQRGSETLKLTAKPGRLGLRLENKPKAAEK